MNHQLLTAAHAAWSAGASLRNRRERFKRYTYGDQWSDPVKTPDGRVMTEGQRLGLAGRQPLVNNLIRRLVKTIVGRYRHLCDKNGRYSTDPDSADVINQLPELDSRLLEEFLISGCAVQRVAPDVRPAGAGVWVDNVNPAAFFTDRFADPRGTDIQMAGMLHQMTLQEILARFGHTSRNAAQRISGLYGTADTWGAGGFTGADTEFFTCSTPGRHRVIELWTLDALRKPDRNGVVTPPSGFAWNCRWLTPGGDLLASYRSPWKHGKHPFVFKFYPYTDGEVHPFVEDIIDQQRYINRLIVLIDKMMGASAKGVLLFPVDQMVKGVTWEDIAARWSAADGIIPIAGRSNILPQQVSSAGMDAGAHKLLELELKLFEDVSGVGDALLGKGITGNSGAELFESRLEAATIALADIFDTFNNLTGRRDQMVSDLY